MYPCVHVPITVKRDPDLTRFVCKDDERGTFVERHNAQAQRVTYVNSQARTTAYYTLPMGTRER